MTLDDLIRAAGLAGGTEADSAYREPTPAPRPSLGLGIDLFTGAPRAIGGQAMEAATEPPQRLPGPSGEYDSPGHAGSIWERIGALGDLPHVPFYTEGRHRSNPLLALLALASGYANARGHLAQNDKLERLQFANKEEQAVASRKAERDQAFLRARETAGQLRREKQAITERRIEQMNSAIGDHETRLQAWKIHASSAQTQEELDTAKRQAAGEQAAIDRIRRDLSKLTGETALEQAGIAAPTGEVPGLPSAPPRPPKAGTAGAPVNISPQAWDIVQQIKAGKIRPSYVKTLSSRSGLRDQVVSGLASEGIDVTELERTSEAEQRFTGTINGRQFTMLRGAEKTVQETLKALWDANEAVATHTKFGPSEELNKKADLFYKNFPGEGYNAIDNRTAIAAATRDQIAVILQAGGTPTETAQEIANNIIQSDRTTPPQRLRNQLKQAAKQFGLRETIFGALKPQKTQPAQSTRPSLDSFVRPN